VQAGRTEKQWAVYSILYFSSGRTSNGEQHFLTSAKYFQSSAVMGRRRSISPPDTKPCPLIASQRHLPPLYKTLRVDNFRLRKLFVWKVFLSFGHLFNSIRFAFVSRWTVWLTVFSTSFQNFNQWVFVNSISCPFRCIGVPTAANSFRFLK
jgi:hypothetical protein